MKKINVLTSLKLKQIFNTFFIYEVRRYAVESYGII